MHINFNTRSGIQSSSFDLLRHTGKRHSQKIFSDSDYIILSSQIYLLRAVAEMNPFHTSHFLWLDVGRCPHVVDAPLNLSFMSPAVRFDAFVIFAAYDTVTPCFGSLSRSRRTSARARAAMEGRREASNRREISVEPKEILRAQLMGGSLIAIEKVAYLYDEILLDWMRRGEVFEKEEPILTLAWDMVKNKIIPYF